MNIYFENILCESCTPANYKTPNYYFKVNFPSLSKELFDLYIILKPHISTTCGQQLYSIAPITRKHILKIVSRRLQTMQSNHSINLVFIQESLSRKHTGRAPSYLMPACIANMMELSHYFKLSSEYLRSLYLRLFSPSTALKIQE